MKATQPTQSTSRIRDLLTLFGELSELHEQLAGLIQRKIDAMKRSDLRAMHELNQEERSVAETIRCRDGLRRQLADEVGRGVGLSPRAGRVLSARQLAEHLSDEQAKTLVDSAAVLREWVERVARMNRVAGFIASEVLGHLDWVMGSVRRGRAGVTGYADSGSPVGAPNSRILDAVG